MAEEQVEGDCKKLVCEGGEIRAKDDDSDEPDGDGNPCHGLSCKGGVMRIVNVENGTSCNDTGTCQAGRCTVCNEGQECTRSSDCTVFKIRCVDGMSVCEDTHVPREGRAACQSGKVCDDGSCVPCVVGAQCDVATPCFMGRVKSCEDHMDCEPLPQSGTACGKDAAGVMMYCVKGLCMAPCREGPCMTGTAECQTSLWDCSGSSSPTCMSVPAEDGSPCGYGGACRDGSCVQRALVNGDFSKGLEGWMTSGQADSFRIQPDPKNYQRITLSTSPDGTHTGGPTRGSISQSFNVPPDALALRFNLTGGHAHVRLKDASGKVIEDVMGVDDESWFIPVNWELATRRGQKLTLAIEDDVDKGDYAYVKTTGFDIVRDVEVPLRNSQFAREYDGWETSGDGLYFNVYTDYAYYTTDSLDSGVASYGTRRSVSTYSRNAIAAAYGAATRGTVSQMFLVPNDAVALRFAVCGGRLANISLYRGAEKLRTVAAADSDTHKVPVSWDLQPYRGMMLKLSIEDGSTALSFGYIGTTGFDVITSYNGP